VAVPVKRQRFKRRKKVAHNEKKLLTRRGPKEHVRIEDLISSRNRLVSLLEATWCDSIWNLENLRGTGTRADVRRAVQIWDQDYYREEFVVKMLLRPSSEDPPRTTKLKAMNNQLIQLRHAIRDSSDTRQQHLNLLNRTKSAFAAELRKEQRDLLSEKTAKLEKYIVDEENTCASMANTPAELQEVLFDGYASFAQEQLLDFLEKHRYRLTPERIANALAGLPFIGWRQSAKKFVKRRCENANGLNYRVHRFIGQIVASRPWQTDLIEHARKMTYRKRQSDSQVASDLQRNWPSLEAAIETVLNTDHERTARVYRIASEYFRRVSQPTNIDPIIAEIKRIVP